MYLGNDFLLEILYGNNWLTLGGMKSTKFEIKRDKFNISDGCASSWQELGGAGMQYINVYISGVGSNSQAEAKLLQLAISGSLSTFRLIFSGNMAMQGDFQVLNYERSGFVNEDEHYNFVLSSAGIVNQFLISI